MKQRRQLHCWSITPKPIFGEQCLLTMAVQHCLSWPLASGVGYAAPFGEGRLTRIFQAGDIRLVDDGQDGLTLHLTDYTAPRLSMKIAGADDRAAWQARLNNLGGAK